VSEKSFATCLHHAPAHAGDREEDNALGLLLALADEAAAPQGSVPHAKDPSADAPSAGLGGDAKRRRLSSGGGTFGALGRQPAEGAQAAHQAGRRAAAAEPGGALEKFSGLRVRPVHLAASRCHRVTPRALLTPMTRRVAR